MIKAAFFDIEGTLIGFKTHRVPESAWSAIEAMRERGIKVCIASGRSTMEMQDEVKTGFDAYVTMNGQLCYDADGVFVMEEPLGPLLRQAEQYARQKGYRNLKYVIGSTGMSCHGRPLGDFAEELRTLHANSRAHFDYFRSIGFLPAGFLPNCYGENWHGILMVKPLL